MNELYASVDIRTKKSVFDKINIAITNKKTITLFGYIIIMTILAMTAVVLWSSSLYGNDADNSVSEKVSNNATKKSKPIWCLAKEYKFNDMNTVRDEWSIQGHSSSRLNIDDDEMEDCACGPDTIDVRNGKLIIRAFRNVKNLTYHTSILTSKMNYTSLNYEGKF